MVKIRVSITIDKDLIEQVDKIVEDKDLKSRSFYIEKSVKEQLKRDFL